MFQRCESFECNIQFLNLISVFKKNNIKVKIGTKMIYIDIFKVVVSLLLDILGGMNIISNWGTIPVRRHPNLKSVLQVILVKHVIRSKEDCLRPRV